MKISEVIAELQKHEPDTVVLIEVVNDDGDEGFFESDWAVLDRIEGHDKDIVIHFHIRPKEETED
jgi:hypothetical protein